MTCTSPYLVPSSNPDGGFQVPCGRCLACRVARSREWATRIVCELGYHDYAHFYTLTYDDEHLVRGYKDRGYLFKTHLQKHIREVRRNCPPKMTKYFACGEYGEDRGRPHYHVLFFGCKNTGIYQDCWPHGEVRAIGTVTYDSARYVADYMFKQYHDPDFAADAVQLPQPFILMSQGLGRRFAEDNEAQIRHLGFSFYIRDGRRVGVPRYFRKILGITTEEFRDSVNESGRAREIFDFWRSRPEGVPPANMSRATWLHRFVVPAARAQSERTLLDYRSLRDDKL